MARLVKRARREHDALMEGFDYDWMSDDDDDDDEHDHEYDNEYSEAAMASTPPTGMSTLSWTGYQFTVRTHGFARARAPRPPLPIGRGVPAPTHTATEVAHVLDHPNTRCVNIKQPWATLIAQGLKDVENRTTRLVHNGGGDEFCWVAIVASAHDPIKDATQWRAKMRDVERRIYWNNGFDAVDLPVVSHDKADYPSQSVVAVAKMACSDPKPADAAWTGKQSVWNNGDTYAWEVLEVHPLARPVWFGKGFQSPAVFLTPSAGDVEHQRAMREVRRAIQHELLRDQEDAPVDAPVATSDGVLAAIDRVGCATLANVVDATGFLHDLGVGTRAWFFEQLERALQMTPDTPQLVHQKQRWYHVYTEAQRMAVLRRFDPNTTVGVERIFDDKKRQEHLPEDVRAFLNGRIRFVKQGNANMGLASMHKSWSLKGFGKWARINPGIGLTITTHTLELLRSQGFAAHLEDQLPHIIYKPPGGEKLGCHHDGIPPSRLLELLRDRRDKTMMEWAREFGMQTLCHVEGGVHDGYTFIMGPMTPNKLFVCIDALFRYRIPGAFANAEEHRNWTTATKGPYFAKWTTPTVLAALNKRLADEGETPIREIPIRPSGTASAGAYVAMWPIGVPHGSSKNKTRRVTITLPIGTRGAPLPAGSRAERRLQALATVASSDEDLRRHGVYGGTVVEQRRAAEAFLAQDTVPLADGPTHVHPEYAAEYVRHREGAAQLQRAAGPYASIAPTLPEVRAYLSA